MANSSLTTSLKCPHIEVVKSYGLSAVVTPVFLETVAGRSLYGKSSNRCGLLRLRLWQCVAEIIAEHNSVKIILQSFNL